MKHYFILFISFLVLSFASNAQDNHGFYGKKNFIQFSSSSYIPAIYAITHLRRGRQLTFSGNALEATNDWFNIGARVSFGRAVKSNLGLAIEVGYDQFALSDNVLYGTSINPNTYVSDHESFKIHSILILPRIEISGRNGLLPNGLVHQIGVGATINSVVKKNYLLEYSNGTISGGPNGADEDQEELFDDFNLLGSVKLMQLMYGLKMRTPVGKSLMINYGFRYTIDFGFSPFGYNRYVAREIIQYQFRNVLAFDLGLTLAL